MSVWRQFNKFLIRLDRRPPSWEERTALFIAYSVDRGMKSATVRSYISAIKRTLIDDGYQWNQDKILLTSLTRACKVVNDTVHTRLPIQCGLLELILFGIQRKFEKDQPYLLILYQALFALGYYGLMRVGELTLSQHTLKARNVHMGENKEKLLLVLYSSKTHGRESRPQKIKITSNKCDKVGNFAKRHFCPFVLVNRYIESRDCWKDDDEPFFVFHDRNPVTAIQARCLLRDMIENLGLDPSLYDMHSLRIGRTSDLILKCKQSIEDVRRAGRWRTTCVFKYIRE